MHIYSVMQVKQAENKELQQKLESMQKAMKDMKTKFEYVLPHIHIRKLIWAVVASVLLMSS